MLVGVVLEGFGKAHGGQAAFQEGQVVAAAQGAVAALDQVDLKARHIGLDGALQMAAELGRGQVLGAAGGGQSVLLAQAGAKGVDPDVRRKVEQETNQLIVADKSWVDTVLFWRKPAEPVAMVDPKAEAQRLRQLQAEGKPVNDGVVPTIERKRKAPLDGLF